MALTLLNTRQFLILNISMGLIKKNAKLDFTIEIISSCSQQDHYPPIKLCLTFPNHMKVGAYYG